MISKRSSVVTIIDIASDDRGKIYECIRELKQHKPAVIALDIFFSEEKKSVYDSLLHSVINDDAIVASLHLTKKYSIDSPQFSGTRMSLALPIFHIDENNDYFWSPSYIVNGTNYKQFAFNAALAYSNRVVFEKFRLGSEDMTKEYAVDFERTIDKYEVILFNSMGDLNDARLNGKITLVGSLSDKSDMFNTPLNFCDSATGKTPGILIHANIISDILER